MNSYLYPTIPHWFDKNLEKWKNSGKRYFSFPFLWFEPHTLPKDKISEFWLYLYYSESQTNEESLKRVIQYRGKVIEHSNHIIRGDDIYNKDKDVDSKVWFKCDVVEELRNTSGQYLTEKDFEHFEGKNLLSSIRNSIAPVRRISPAITVQQTRYWLQD